MYQQTVIGRLRYRSSESVMSSEERTDKLKGNA